MTLLDVRELCEYWAEHPPVHILVAAFVGFKAETEVTPGWRDVLAEGRGSTPDWLVQQRLAGIPGVAAGSLPESMSGPVFDVDALMRMRPN